MKLQCNRIRVGGTKVQLGAAEYHFKPESSAPGAAHVCEVNNAAHINTLLKIDAYTLYEAGADDGEQAVSAAADAMADAAMVATPGNDPLENAKAHPLEGMTLEILSAKTEEELRALYNAATGKNAHHKMGHAKLAENLAAMVPAPAQD